MDQRGPRSLAQAEEIDLGRAAADARSCDVDGVRYVTRPGQGVEAAREQVLAGR